MGKTRSHLKIAHGALGRRSEEKACFMEKAENFVMLNYGLLNKEIKKNLMLPIIFKRIIN